MTGEATDGYVSIGTFEKKLWNIKGEVDKVVKERKTECDKEHNRIYTEASDMKLNIMANNKCINDLKVDMAEVKNNVDWLKRTYWIVVAASIGSLVAAVFNIILK